jgi:hypothetical protein
VRIASRREVRRIGFSVPTSKRAFDNSSTATSITDSSTGAASYCVKSFATSEALFSPSDRVTPMS